MALTLSIRENKKLKNFDKLSEIFVDLLHLINEYAKEHSLRNEVIIHSLDQQLQMIKKDTCEIYQIYFYVNLFNPLENSGIFNEKKLDSRTIERLLNKILSTDIQENESRKELFT